jgi:hypothetical protein
MLEPPTLTRQAPVIAAPLFLQCIKNRTTSSQPVSAAPAAARTDEADPIERLCRMMIFSAPWLEALEPSGPPHPAA